MTRRKSLVNFGGGFRGRQMEGLAVETGITDFGGPPPYVGGHEEVRTEFTWLAPNGELRWGGWRRKDTV